MSKYAYLRLMRPLVILAATLSGLGASAAYVEETITVGTLPGTVLQHGHRYTVNGNVTIDASGHPGMSALRVPVGAAVILDIPAGASLSVHGGNAYRKIQGGAGIEVPYGAKLVITGSGTLNAVGGAASEGGSGYGGWAGTVSAYAVPARMKDEKKLPFPAASQPTFDIRNGVCSTNFCEPALAYGRAGTGGIGGEGGGGAGAAIGGMGGRGGEGGMGGIGNLCIPRDKYNARKKNYDDCAKYFGLPSVFVFDRDSQFRLDGSDGFAGGAGGRGRAGGEIIFAGSVTVKASGTIVGTVSGGESGSYGSTYRVYEDAGHWDRVEKAATGISGASSVVGLGLTVYGAYAVGVALANVTVAGIVGGVVACVCTIESVIAATGVFDRARLKKMQWFTGGGGGGGGGGGSGLAYAIGNGAPGGGGGGGGGSGLFAVGLGSVFGVDRLSRPDLTSPPADLAGVGGAGGEGAGLSGAGKRGGDPERKPYRNASSKVNARPYNFNDGHYTAWSWLRSKDNWVNGGNGAAGGKGGETNLPPATVWYSDAGSVSGLPPSAKKFSGAVSYTVTFNDYDGSGGSTTQDYLCGSLIGTAPMTARQCSKGYFAGYYTATTGGSQYFDRFGRPAIGATLSENVTLHARWIADNPDVRITSVVNAPSGKQMCTSPLEANKIYYFGQNVVYGDPIVDGGLRLSPGTTVFYIKKGVTVGSYGFSSIGANHLSYPGVQVPTGSTLIVVGGGTLRAWGGVSTCGYNGEAGGGAAWQKNNESETEGGEEIGVKVKFTNGKGGAGGKGGSGAAPGIGGIGGAGGAGAQSPSVVTHTSDDGTGFRRYGANGSQGSAGGNGTGMGSVYVLSSTVQAYAGAVTNEVASAGAEGSKTDYSYGSIHVYGAGGGGGGGGGGTGGGPRYAIGGGGGGGGGGGSGGSGGFYYKGGSSIDRDYLNGGGGGGGEGSVKGKNAVNHPRYSSSDNRGGTGGAAGVAGQAGDDGELYVDVNARVEAGEGRPKMLAWGHPVLERTITFMYGDKKLGEVSAMLGTALPPIPTNCLYGVRGYALAGAYRVQGGATIWWYGMDGESLRDYDDLGDVTLQIAVRPKWEAMAMLPEPLEVQYAGSNHVAYVAGDYDGCTCTGGVTNAVNAGVYRYGVRLDPGYEIWSDLNTNEFREVEWYVRRLAITNDWQTNILTYDWTLSRQENEAALTADPAKTMGFALPPGVTLGFDFASMQRKAENLFSVQARLSGGTNFCDRTCYGAYYIPKILNMMLVPTYPWGVGAQIVYSRPYETSPEQVQKFIDCYGTNSLVASVMCDCPGARENLIGERFVDVELCKIRDFVYSGRQDGYVDVDFAQALKAAGASAFRTNALPIYLSIAGVHFAYGEIPIDLTGDTVAANGTNWQHYVVNDVADIYPVRASWRFVDDRSLRNENSTVELAIGESVSSNAWFVPYTRQSAITDIGVAWKPAADGEYVLEHRVLYPQQFGGAVCGYRRAYFTVNGLGPKPVPKTVVEVVRKATGKRFSYSSLKDAVAELCYGDTLIILGDVQMEVEKIPSGSTVTVGENGIFRRTTSDDLRQDYYTVDVTTNGAGKVTGAVYAIKESEVCPQVAAGESGEPALVLLQDEQGNVVSLAIRIANMKGDLFYSISSSSDLKVWSTSEKQPTAALEGGTYVLAPIVGPNRYYRVSVTDDPTPDFLTEAKGDGTLSVTGLLSTVSTSVVIPTNLVGRTVTEIGAGAFSGRADVFSMELPDTVTKIGASAFAGCSTLRRLVLPEGLTDLGDSFITGTRISDLVVPSNVVRTGAWNAPATLKSVRFMGNGNPTVALPELGTNGWVYVQPGSTGWGNVPRTLPDGTRLTYWQSYTYRGLGNAEVAVTGAGDLGCGVLDVPATLDGLKVTAIAEGAFTNRGDITEIRLPDSVTSVGEAAFLNCTALKSVRLGTGLKDIGGYAFGDFNARSGISQVDFTGMMPTVGEDVGLDPAKCLIFVEDGATGWEALPCFWQGCLVQAKNAAMRYSLAEDGSLVLERCAEGLRYVEVPVSVAGCPVSTVSKQAFVNSTNLQMLVFGSAPPKLSGDGYLELPSSCTVVRRAGVLGWGDEWEGYPVEILQNFKYVRVSEVELDEEEEEALDGVDDGADEPVFLTGLAGSIAFFRLWIPPYVDGHPVRGIGKRAFFGKERICDLEIADGVLIVGSDAFARCTGLSVADLGNTVRMIGADAFEYDVFLSEIYLPGSMHSIGYKVLSYSLEEVHFRGHAPKKVKTQSLNPLLCTIYVPYWAEGFGKTWQDCTVERELSSDEP